MTSHHRPVRNQARLQRDVTASITTSCVDSGCRSATTATRPIRSSVGNLTKIGLAHIMAQWLLAHRFRWRGNAS